MKSSLIIFADRAEAIMVSAIVVRYGWPQRESADGHLEIGRTATGNQRHLSCSHLLHHSCVPAPVRGQRPSPHLSGRWRCDQVSLEVRGNQCAVATRFAGRFPSQDQSEVGRSAWLSNQG